jgi:CBS domain-containing protein
LVFLADAVRRLRSDAAQLLPILRQRTVWMLNSTARGGGVAEMMPGLVGTLRDLGVALSFGLLGLFYNPMLILIALFVWMGAQQESSLARLKSALVGIPVRSAMLTDFRTLAPDDALARAVDMVIAGSQHDFPVVEAGRPIGLLTRTELAQGLAKDGAESPVAPWMRRNLRIVDPLEMVDAVVNRLREDETAVLVVDKGGQLVGMLTSENIGELVMLRGALRGDRGGWPRVPRTA